ncbi:MoaD/ThiS family protein [Phenylobacterium sp.]|jgi:molybdopterin converting factor small subunit|uniref:MoaD/ThiS family protein n=1 Tax=Phenylobacterium sp. TaxID=1871053 RepID=UPI002F3EC7F2
MTRVLIPSQLIAYTGGATRVEAQGPTVDAVMRDLDRRFAGLRFRVVDEQGRIRRHMRIYVGQDRVHDIARPLDAGDEVLIFGALSGG